MLFFPLLALVASFAPAVFAGKGFTGKRVIAGYWPSYGNLAAADVRFDRYTHLDYFVFTTTSSASVISTAGETDAKIFDFVNRAHAAGITTSFTIGGYTGSQYFSTHVSTAANRQLFARTLFAAMQKYGFDGIDIDWEYPGTQGIGNNIVSPNDAANLALFLATLRSVAGVDARLSMAVAVGGIDGPNGKLTDLRSMASSLDYITIMVYDIVGYYSPTTGPNSPLYDGCSTGYSRYSVDRSVRLYNAAGFAKSHMLVGFPAYSYTYTVNPPLTTRSCPDGSTSLLWQEKVTSTTCGNYVGDGNGQILYRQISENKYLGSRSGFITYRDTASAQVLLYNPKTKLFIPTEDISTGKTKGAYIRAQGLGGVGIFSIDGDNIRNDLVTSLRTGMRFNTGTIFSSRMKRALQHLQVGH